MKRLFLILVPALLLGGLVFFGLQYFFGATDKGALQVTATPKSKVYADGKYIGDTPLCACEGEKMLAVRDYTIKIVPVNGQFLPVEDRVTITKSVLTVIDKTFAKGAATEGSLITLSPLSDPRKQQLVIVTIPDRSTALLDTNESGMTPLSITDITESDHTVTVQKTGYKDKSIRIHTPAGYKLLLTISMAVSDEMIPSLTPIPVASISASIPPTEAAKIQILQTPSGFLRVRENGTLTAPEIGRVTPSETYELLSEKEGWYQIKLTTGVLGWVSSDYAKKLNGQVAP